MENEEELLAMLNGIGGDPIEIDVEGEAERSRAYKVLLSKSMQCRDKSERGEECVPEVTNVIQEANKLAQKVRATSTLHLDALVLHNSSLVLKNCTDRMGSEMNEYKGSMLAAGLLPYNLTRNFQNGQNKMETLAKWSSKVFSSAICNFVGHKGTIDDEPEVKEKTRPQGRRRQNLDNLPVSKPQIADATSKEKDLLSFFINIIMKALIEREKQTKAPVPIYQLLLNPHSFSETVENMFYFAHIIKEGLVVITYDEDDLPLIRRKRDSDRLGKINKMKDANSHMIFDMDKTLWKRLVQVYKIKKPMIQSRDDQDP